MLYGCVYCYALTIPKTCSFHLFRFVSCSCVCVCVSLSKCDLCNQMKPHMIVAWLWTYSQFTQTNRIENTTTSNHIGDYFDCFTRKVSEITKARFRKWTTMVTNAIRYYYNSVACILYVYVKIWCVTWKKKYRNILLIHLIWLKL